MLDTDIWEKLDALQKETVEKRINAEWLEIQLNAQKELINAARNGDRRVHLEVKHKVNAERLQGMITALQNFTCDVMSAQGGFYKVNISF